MVICTLVSTPKHDEQWCGMLNVVMMLANVMRSSGASVQAIGSVLP